MYFMRIGIGFASFEKLDTSYSLGRMRRLISLAKVQESYQLPWLK